MSNSIQEQGGRNNSQYTYKGNDKLTLALQIVVYILTQLLVYSLLL